MKRILGTDADYLVAFLVIVILAVALIAVSSCSKKADSDVSDTNVADVTIAFSPLFPDGTQLYSSDAGRTWRYVPRLAKLVTCSCDCATNAHGTYPGSCRYGAQDYTCQDWCTFGGVR